MTHIMAHLQQYVPLNTQEDEEVDPMDGEAVKIFIDNFHYVLFGGDQLTVERAFGAKNSKKNENRALEQLDGLLPVIEDWHAKVCMLKVCLLHFNVI
jgi:L1 cell adhesion molecule like protein